MAPIALALLLAAPAPAREGPALAHRQAERFTTLVTLTVVADQIPAEILDRGFAAVLAELDRLDGLLSEWRPDSPISALNRGAGGPAQVVPAELFELLVKAKQLAAVTRGGFDPTFKTLSGLWPLKRADFRPPSSTAIEALRPATGVRHLRLSRQGRRARLDDPRTQIGLGAVAKGYALERAIGLLRGVGIDDFCLRIGGELYCGGDKGGQAWLVGIRDPRRPEGVVAMLPVRDAAFTTSGDYERYVDFEGTRYHHILDLRTGAPARGVRSVTILARNPTEADALSTGVFVLGVTEGLKLIEGMPAAEAVIIDAAGALHPTSGLRGKLALGH